MKQSGEDDPDCFLIFILYVAFAVTEQGKTLVFLAEDFRI